MRDFIVEAVRGSGMWGVAALMFLENVFPPIPSELIMPLAGYLAADDALRFWPTVTAGTVGSLLGAALWYGVGRRLGLERLRDWAGRHGSWVAMTPDDIDKAGDWFRRHGGTSVFLGRLVPFVRTAISIPAGLAEMAAARFLLFSAAGTFLWTLALTWAGRLLGRQFPQVESALGWASWFVIGAATAWYVYRVVVVHRRKSDSD